MLTLLGHLAVGQICLYADDRLDALLFGLAEEIDHTEHRAVVGDAQRRHAHLLGAADQLRDLAEAVQ